ncbi:MAG: MarR family transcriptional regulator [Actinobacteria bacterium]|jgi:DNA-binding MarR family transcriptional regulator|nr:MarR family transcriptional regulator [Actinomycetota bacterium]
MSDHVSNVVSQWARRRPELDLTGMAVFGRIYRLARLADRMRSAALERHDLQLGDVDVMAALWRHDGGLRPLDLRASMLIGSGTLTARLDRLESAGLLERRPDPDDRRGRLLYLTPDGERLLPGVVEELLQIENDLLAPLPATVRDRLAGDLGRLLASTEGQEGAGAAGQ